MTGSLDDYLDDLDALEPEIEANNFIPNKQDEQAARALRQMGRLRARIDANKSAAERERGKITNWETRVNEPLQTRYAFLHSLLTKYAINERHLDPTRKTIQTPHGTLATKPAQPKWEIDAETFVAWAKKHAPNLVKTTEVPRLADLKKTFEAKEGQAVDTMLGVVAEGVKITPPDHPYTATIDPA